MPVRVAEEDLLPARFRNGVFAEGNSALFQTMLDRGQIVDLEGQVPVARLDRPTRIRNRLVHDQVDLQPIVEKPRALESRNSGGRSPESRARRDRRLCSLPSAWSIGPRDSRNEWEARQSSWPRLIQADGAIGKTCDGGAGRLAESPPRQYSRAGMHAASGLSELLSRGNVRHAPTLSMVRMLPAMPIFSTVPIIPPIRPNGDLQIPEGGFVT